MKHPPREILTKRCGGLYAVLAALLLTAVTTAMVALTHTVHDRVDLAHPGPLHPATPVLHRNLPAAPAPQAVPEAAAAGVAGAGGCEVWVRLTTAHVDDGAQVSDQEIRRRRGEGRIAYL